MTRRIAMRHYLFYTIVFMLLVADVARAQDQVRTLEQRLPIEAGQTVLLENYKGSITVRQWDEADVRIQARVESEGGEGVVMVPYVQVVMQAIPTGLRASADYNEAIRQAHVVFGPGATHKLPSVHFTVDVPAGARVKVEDYMSDVNTQSLSVPLEVYSYKGQITIRDAQAPVSLNTSLGRAAISFSGNPGSARLETDEGTLLIQLPTAAAFNLNAILGTSKAGFTADQAFGITMPPTLKYAGPVNGGGAELRLYTQAGSIQIVAR